MKVYDGLGEIKAYAGARNSVGTLVEQVEEMVERIFVNAAAAVPDLDVGRVGACGNRDLYVTSGRCVFKGVGFP